MSIVSNYSETAVDRFKIKLVLFLICLWLVVHKHLIMNLLAQKKTCPTCIYVMFTFSRHIPATVPGCLAIIRICSDCN